MCAGIYDERIAITAPNSSGTGGTGSLRYFEDGQRPQTIGHHIGRNERWFHPRYFQFAHHEDRLPFDAHFAKALIAPRALVNCHARQDYWANPYGTELTHRAAEIVFKWLGAGNRIALHWREGKHAQNEEDWAALLDLLISNFLAKKQIGNSITGPIRTPTCLSTGICLTQFLRSESEALTNKFDRTHATASVDGSDAYEGLR